MAGIVGTRTRKVPVADQGTGTRSVIAIVEDDILTMRDLHRTLREVLWDIDEVSGFPPFEDVKLRWFVGANDFGEWYERDKSLLRLIVLDWFLDEGTTGEDVLAQVADHPFPLGVLVVSNTSVHVVEEGIQKALGARSWDHAFRFLDKLTFFGDADHQRRVMRRELERLMKSVGRLRQIRSRVEHPA